MSGTGYHQLKKTKINNQRVFFVFVLKTQNAVRELQTKRAFKNKANCSMQWAYCAGRRGWADKPKKENANK